MAVAKSNEELQKDIREANEAKRPGVQPAATTTSNVDHKKDEDQENKNSDVPEKQYDQAGNRIA